MALSAFARETRPRGSLMYPSHLVAYSGIASGDRSALESRVDRRDEVLHTLERARSIAAAHLFLGWLEELEVVD
jgi:hypothetical protein